MAMVDDLRSAHGEVARALDVLERLTRAHVPDESAVALARVNLSRASGKRRRLIDAITSQLLEGASEADAARLRELRAQNADQLKASTAHIGAWGLQNVLADWPGYCRASVTMRKSIRDLIAADRETLIPMLENARAA